MADIIIDEANFYMKTKRNSWNLADAEKHDYDDSGSETYYPDDVKKCRDLILEDITNGLTHPAIKSELVKIINKRFGDLK